MFVCGLGLVVLVALAIVDEGASATVNDCPADLPRDKYLTVYNNWCFQFVYNRRKTYSNANAECKSHGGTLALIKTPDIQAYLFHQVSLHVFLHGEEHDALWIGLNDVVTEGTFIWEDGSPLTYSYFAGGSGPNKPPPNDQDCVALGSVLGLWLDERCDANFITSPLGTGLPYICQYDAKKSTTK